VRAWNIEKIDQCFMPVDADVIKGIPLSTTTLADFWSWHYERRSVFSVRSAYRMLVATKQRREAWLNGSSGSSNTDAEFKSWCKIWKVQVPESFFYGVWRNNPCRQLICFITAICRQHHVALYVVQLILGGILC
jgi:hypothetical protein